MDSGQIALLRAVHNAGSLRGNTSQERDRLDLLVMEGYLRREDPESPFPNKPVYRLTVLGLAIVKDDSPTET
jgi:hypothetical protein